MIGSSLASTKFLTKIISQCTTYKSHQISGGNQHTSGNPPRPTCRLRNTKMDSIDLSPCQAIPTIWLLSVHLMGGLNATQPEVPMPQQQ